VTLSRTDTFNRTAGINASTRSEEATAMPHLRQVGPERQNGEVVLHPLPPVVVVVVAAGLSAG
jgi:hypothetical protein